MDKKFVIPIEFTVYGKTENDALYLLQRFLRDAIKTEGLEHVIKDHDLIESLQEPTCGGCGNHHSFEGVPS